MDQSYNVKRTAPSAADLNLNLKSVRMRLSGLCKRADMIVAAGGTPPTRIIARMEHLIITEAALLAASKSEA